jgi:D-cysteine desulfhydrase
MTDYLGNTFPVLGERLQRTRFASLPTPVSRETLHIAGIEREIWVKHDDVSGTLYGGNKVRKLEYILQKAALRKATRIATFGAVASNHALATSLYARQLGLNCTCFLSHQQADEKCARTLDAHIANKTELVYYGGSYHSRVETLRKHAQGRNCWIVPVGGSSWLGSVGFVNAAFELAEQITANDLPCPGRIYVATGTMGTAAGLALGLALAGLPTSLHAVRVTDERFASRKAMQRLINKIAMMLRLYGADIPDDIGARVRINFRDEFFGDGYAKSNAETDRAVAIAGEQAELRLESTYTGKAMRALLHDLQVRDDSGEPVLFWNTFNSRPWPIAAITAADREQLPDPFKRYFQGAL